MAIRLFRRIALGASGEIYVGWYPHRMCRWCGSFVVLVVGVFLLVGCGDLGSGGRSVDAVLISGAPSSLVVGESVRLTAVVASSGGAPDSVVWSSSDSGVAVVSGDGVVLGVSPGGVTIVASSTFDSGKRASVRIVVEDATSPGDPVDPPGDDDSPVDDVVPGVEGVSIDGSGVRRLEVGEVLRLSVSVSVVGGAPETVSWSSGDSGLVAVSSDGVVSARGVGRAVVSAVSTFDSSKRDEVVIIVDSVAEGWGWRIDSGGEDQVVAMAVDGSDRVVVGGVTTGSLAGPISGDYDSFVQVYEGNGELAWQHQFADDTFFGLTSVAVDSRGRIVTASHGDVDVDGFNGWGDSVEIRVFSPTGELLWRDSHFPYYGDVRPQVAVDSNDRVILVGHDGPYGDHDVVVRVYEPDGTVAWQQNFRGTGHEYVLSVGVDREDRIVVAGNTNPSSGLDAEDIGVFVRALNPDGSEAWSDQFGSKVSSQGTADVHATASGQVIVAGITYGDTFSANPGEPNEFGNVPPDGFVRAYSMNGEPLWSDQFGTPGYDEVWSIASNSSGDVVLGGWTSGELVEGAQQGGVDAYLRAYDADGMFLWHDQFGTPENEGVSAVAYDSRGNLVVAGVGGGDDGYNEPRFGFVVRHPFESFPPPAR